MVGTGDLGYVLVTLLLVAAIVASKIHNHWVKVQEQKKKKIKRKKAIN